ncbi:MAG: hypothetical protein J1E42_09300, partial [Akkermansiaceae bacterium]|nr:hypothetical protein [Akkermansiaceae bacterium]
KRRFPWWLVGVLYVAALVSSRVGRKTTGFQKWALPTVAVTSEPFSVPVRLTRDARLLAHAEPKLNPWRACRFCLALPAKDRATKLPLFDLGGGSGTASGEVVCVMGDSHATDLCEGIGHMLRREPGEVSFVYLASVVAPFHGWDFPLRTARSDYYFNPPKEEALFAWLEAHPEVTRLMIAFRWQHQIQQQMHLTSQAAEADLRAFLQRARSLGRQVFLMAPVYEFQSAFTRMTRVLYLRGMGLDDERFVRLNTCTRAQYQAAHGETLRMLRQLESEGLCVVLDPISALPPDEGYGAVKDGVLLYRDSNHLTASGSVWLIEKIWPQLQQKLALPPTQP